MAATAAHHQKGVCRQVRESASGGSLHGPVQERRVRHVQERGEEPRRVRERALQLKGAGHQGSGVSSGCGRYFQGRAHLGSDLRSSGQGQIVCLSPRIVGDFVGCVGLSLRIVGDFVDCVGNLVG